MMQIYNEETYQKDVWAKLLEEAGDGKGSRPSVETYAKIQNHCFKSFLVSFQNKHTVNNSTKVATNNTNWSKRTEK